MLQQQNLNAYLEYLDESGCHMEQEYGNARRDDGIVECATAVRREDSTIQLEDRYLGEEKRDTILDRAQVKPL